MKYPTIMMSDTSALPPLSWSSVSFMADPLTEARPVVSRALSSIVADDAVYDNYVVTTNDPGNILFIIALTICLGSLVALPVAVKIGRARQRRHLNQRLENSEERHPEDHLSLYQRLHRIYTSVLKSRVDSILLRQNPCGELNANNDTAEEVIDSTSNSGVESVARACDDLQNVEVSRDGQDIPLPTLSNQEVESNREESCRETVCSHPLAIMKFDNESKRILKLAVPFVMNSISSTMGDLLLLGIISQNLGTDSMIAFAMVDVIVGVSSSFMMGWVDAINSLGAMAHGADNYELLGQYVQASVLIYLICEVPMAFIWGVSMQHIILLFGFNEATASIAKDYVWVYVAGSFMEGVFKGFHDFLGIINREKSAMVCSCSAAICEVALVIIVIKSIKETNLVLVGLVMLTNQCFFFFLIILVSSWNQWTRPYEYGMIGKLSLLNRDVVKVMFKTGTPLAVGGLLAYAEWEVLTIFAAVLGPAEAATWAILAFVWDVFESTTGAIGDAAEVRCAYQLGKGRPETAKLSAFKSLTLSFVVASIVTTTFLLLADYLPLWLTTDQTIQNMLADLFPLVGLGNITMTVGMVCWSLVGSQARYRLATTIALTCTFLITLPLGAITTVWLRIDLRGLTFSVVVGYVICALLLTIILLLSDWDKLSKDIRERVIDGDLDIEGSSTSSSDSGHYDSTDWDDLPADVQSAAVLLGYTNRTWSNEEDPNELKLPWMELTPEQQKAVALLGYDQVKWNGNDSVDEGKNSTTIDVYDCISDR